jgi:hypothetical protein
VCIRIMRWCVCGLTSHSSRRPARCESQAADTIGLLTFSINVTLDGCVDHQEGIADDETHAFFTRLMHEGVPMLWGRVTYEMMDVISRRLLERVSFVRVHEVVMMFQGCEQLVSRYLWHPGGALIVGPNHSLERSTSGRLPGSIREQRKGDIDGQE